MNLLSVLRIFTELSRNVYSAVSKGHGIPVCRGAIGVQAFLFSPLGLWSPVPLYNFSSSCEG